MHRLVKIKYEIEKMYTVLLYLVQIHCTIRSSLKQIHKALCEESEGSVIPGCLAWGRGWRNS